MIEFDNDLAFFLSDIYYSNIKVHNNIQLLPEDCYIEEEEIHGLIMASVLYMQKIGVIDVILHNEEKIEGAIFTVNRQLYEEFIKLEEKYFHGLPDERFPNIFEELGNENFTNISLVFNFPNTKIGKLAKRMIDYQHNLSDNDATFIHFVVFTQKYVIYDSAYLGCFNEVLKYNFIHQDDRNIRELIDFFLKHKPKNLYDPFMRTGKNSILTENLYHGQTYYEYYLYTTMLYAGIAGIDTENIEIEDCINNWDPRDCDTIIATPRLDDEGIPHDDGSMEPISTWCLEKVCKSINETCRQGILILPASILTSYGKAEQLRHDITESNLLDTVILLPANIFWESTIATAIIILNKDRAQDTPITFADFSSFKEEPANFDWDYDKPTLNLNIIREAIEQNHPDYICRTNVSEVVENCYEWYTPKYIHKQKEIPSGYIKHKISDIIIKDDSYHEDYGKYNYLLKDADLTSNIFDNYIKHTDITEITGVELEHFFFGSDIKSRSQEEYDKLFGDFLKNGLQVHDGTDFLNCIHTCRFIIDYKKEKLRTYYYEAEGNKIIKAPIPGEEIRVEVDTSLYCLVVPDKYYRYHVNPDLIHIDYLRMLLSQTYSEVRKTYTSENIEDIINTFMNTEVVIPLAIEEQKKLYEQAKTNHILEQARKEGLDEAIKSIKDEYMMEVRMRKHDMKPSLTQLDSLAKLLVHYVDQIDGNETIVHTIKQKLDKISTEVEQLRLHLNRLTEEDIYGTAELFNPIETLKEFTGTFSNYKVELEIDTMAFREAGINTPQIYISKVDFTTLCTTIIENAATHAFIGNDEDYRILITLTYNKEQSNYIIDFMNNGFGLPLGMDKFRYGLKGEKGASSKGTGLGGYRIKSITRHFGGDYDVFCNSSRNRTVIRVKLPKHNAYE